jgi:hypothetical protein
MEELPDIVEIHNFSKGFEKKMKHLVRAEKNFDGKRWLERCVRYTASIVTAFVCLIIINTLSIRAFDFNLWEVIVDYTGDMINIHFESTENSSAPVIEGESENSSAVHYKIGSIPNGYTVQEQYTSDELVVEILKSDNGTITYTESLLTQTADVNIAKGKREQETIGGKEVTMIYAKDNVTAFFTDITYYHIVEIQGKDADREMAINIIESLEEQ